MPKIILNDFTVGCDAFWTAVGRHYYRELGVDSVSTHEDIRNLYDAAAKRMKDFPLPVGVKGSLEVYFSALHAALDNQSEPTKNLNKGATLT